ncbi:conserved hypothetical protein [Frankia sp. Hr75.2]|nr:conserved hypothetical protein [Frankia sp. Hr75.2]
MRYTDRNRTAGSSEPVPGNSGNSDDRGGSDDLDGSGDPGDSDTATALLHTPRPVIRTPRPCRPDGPGN